MKHNVYYDADSDTFLCNGKQYRSEYTVYISAYLRKPNKGILHYIKNGEILGTLDAKIMGRYINAGYGACHMNLKYYNLI